MTSKHLRAVALAAVISAFGLALGAQLSIPGLPSFISAAAAYTNRSMSQVNVQSVARRSTGDCNAALMTVC